MRLLPCVKFVGAMAVIFMMARRHHKERWQWSLWQGIGSLPEKRLPSEIADKRKWRDGQRYLGFLSPVLPHGCLDASCWRCLAPQPGPGSCNRLQTRVARPFDGPASDFCYRATLLSRRNARRATTGLPLLSPVCPCGSRRGARGRCTSGCQHSRPAYAAAVSRKSAGFSGLPN